MPPNEPLKIGITGNIGSGKSSVCHYLEKHGQRVLYADKIAHEVLIEKTPLLIQRWGRKILQNGNIDRAKIAEIVFADSQELDFLNSQIHPGVLQRFALETKQSDLAALCFEIPLLFEAGLEDCFDYLVLVTAPRSKVIERLKVRDPGKTQDHIQRLAVQMPDAVKAEKVDLVIHNDQSLQQLEKEAQKLIESLPKIRKKQSQDFV